MASFSFDTNSVEKRESNYELLPMAWYTAQVSESSIVTLKSGNGQAIKLTFDILSDAYRGRKVWAQLNIRHTNPKAETIAQQQLRELCEAIGLARFSDTVELHNKPMQIKVKIRKDETGQYEDQNEVTGFKPAGGSPAHASAMTAGMAQRAATSGAANAPVVNTPPAPPAAGSVPPWQKRA